VTWTADDFEVRRSTIPGANLGLFARARIRVGDTIGYYTGEVITEREYENGHHADSRYILWVARTHIIVGEGPKANYTRYLNHSSRPNAAMVVSTRWKTARFEAIRAIRPGDEVFFDYGEYYWSSLEVTPQEPLKKNGVIGSSGNQ
jgi:uncharacterized protein